MRKTQINRTWSWIFINHDWWGEAKLDEVTSRVGVFSVGNIVTCIPDSSFLTSLPCICMERCMISGMGEKEKEPHLVSIIQYI